MVCSQNDMDGNVLPRRCAGFKNVSMWMDSILTWDESEPENAGSSSGRFIKAFRPQPKSRVFQETKESPFWSSEAKDNFKAYDLSNINNVSDGAYALISKKLHELKSKHCASKKENDGDSHNIQPQRQMPVQTNTEPIEAVKVQEQREDNVCKDLSCSTSSPNEIPGDVIVDQVAEIEQRKSPEPASSSVERVSLKNAQSSLLLPPPRSKKNPPPRGPSAERQARRQQTSELIKAKWDARRFAQTSKAMSSTRQLSDTAVAFLLGRRPFATFADQTGAKVKDSTRMSFNINPELYPNQPALVQSADSAIERAILKNGPQPIGCRQRIKMLQNSQVRKQLERRKESLARLSQAAYSSFSKSQIAAKPEQDKRGAARRAEGFFVKI